MTDPRSYVKITVELVRIRARVTVRMAPNSLSCWKMPAWTDWQRLPRQGRNPHPGIHLYMLQA